MQFSRTLHSTVHALALSLLLASSTAQSNTSSRFSEFELFKNSGFSLPCDQYDLLNSGPNDLDPETSLSYSSQLTFSKWHAKTQRDFCNQFPVQPTLIALQVNRAAFLPGWPTLAISFVSLCLSFWFLMSSLNKLKPGEKAPLPKMLIATAIVDVTRLVIWWIQVILDARDLLHAGWPSVVIWTVPMTYASLGATIRLELGIRPFGWVKWIRFYAFFHWAFCFAMVIIRWKLRYTSQGSYTPIDYTSQAAQFPAPCKNLNITSQASDFFSDPNVQWYRVTQTLQFMVCSGGFVWIYLWLSGDSGRTNWVGKKFALMGGVGAGYAIVIFFTGFALSMRGTPYRFARGPCNIVAVMMNGRLGYLDVKKDIAWRTVKSVFGVY